MALKALTQSIISTAETAALEDKLKILKEKFTLLAPTFKALKGKNKQEDIKDVWKVILKADPTPTKSYLQWIIVKGISAWKNKQVHFLLEDIPKIKDSLELFDTLKTKNKLKPEHKDINRIINYDDLFAITTSYPDTDSVSDLKKKEEQAFYDKKAAELLLNTAELKIVVPKTKEASIFFGKNTQWCTSAKNDNMFSHYSKKGPLYIILHKPTNRRWQFHFQDHQYMDEKDHDIDQRKFMKLSFFPDLVKVFSPIIATINPKFIDDFSYAMIDNPTEEMTAKIIKDGRISGTYSHVIAVWKKFPPTPDFLKKCLKSSSFKAYYTVHVQKDTTPEAKINYVKEYSAEAGLKKYTFTEAQYLDLMKKVSANLVMVLSKITPTQTMFNSWLKNYPYAYRTIGTLIRSGGVYNSISAKKNMSLKVIAPFITPKAFPDIYNKVSDMEKKSLLIRCLDNPDYYDFAKDTISSWPAENQIKMIKTIVNYGDNGTGHTKNNTASDQLIFDIIKKSNPKFDIRETLAVAERNPSLFLQLPSIGQAIVNAFIRASNSNSRGNRYLLHNLRDFIVTNPVILANANIADVDWAKIVQSLVDVAFSTILNSRQTTLHDDDKALASTLRVLFRRNPNKSMEIINKEIDRILHSELSYGDENDIDAITSLLIKSPWIKAMGVKVEAKNTYLDEFINSAGFLNDKKLNTRDKRMFKKLVEENTDKKKQLKIPQFVGFDDTIDPVTP